MKVLSLDISTKSGWAFFEEGQLKDFGAVRLDRTVLEFGPYPWAFCIAAEEMACMLCELVSRFKPDVLVIEETNLARARYSQKTLEFIHLFSLRWIAQLANRPKEVIYLSTSSWRKTLGIAMTKADKKQNSKLYRAKRTAADLGVKLDKKALGVRGKINKKHLALRYVNETYGLSLKVKDNDAADAICLAAAYLKGCEPCDGVF